MLRCTMEHKVDSAWAAHVPIIQLDLCPAKQIPITVKRWPQSGQAAKAWSKSTPRTGHTAEARPSRSEAYDRANAAPVSKSAQQTKNAAVFQLNKRPFNGFCLSKSPAMCYIVCGGCQADSSSAMSDKHSKKERRSHDPLHCFSSTQSLRNLCGGSVSSSGFALS